MNTRLKIALLGGFLGVCLGASALTTFWNSQVPAVDHAQLYGLIDRQLAALQAEDYETAYLHASTGFHEQFDEAAFEELIRSGYSSLLEAERLEFGSVKIKGNRALVYVFLIQPDGQVMPCIYSLIRERDIWKVEAAKLYPGWPSDRHLGGLQA